MENGSSPGERELGKDAILGPKTIHTKRMNEQAEGATMENKRKRMRRLKYDLIGERWGELPKQQQQEAEGGEQGPTLLQPHTREQELGTEQFLPPLPK